MKKLNLSLLLVCTIFLLTACDNFGKKVKKGHVETYYKDGISEAEALHTAELMYNVDINVKNPIVKKSFQLCKINDTVCLRMVVNDNRFQSMPEENFLALSNYVSDSVFNSAPVNLDFTDNRFKSKKILHYKKVDFK